MCPQLAQSFIVSHRRERIMRAAAIVCVTDSFHGLTVSKIVAKAAIARNTFYETFRSKEDCFVNAFHWAVQMLEEMCLEAESLDAALEELMSFVHAEHALASVVLLEAPAGAPAAYQDTQERFADFTGLEDPIGQMVVGGAMAILARHLRQPTDDLLSDLQGLAQQFAEPVIGSARAMV